MTPDKVKAGRLRAKMTQDEITDLFGLSVRFWRNLENGVNEIPKWVRYALIGLNHEIREKKKRAKIRREIESKKDG